MYGGNIGVWEQQKVGLPHGRDEVGVKGEPSVGSTLTYVVQPQAPKESDDRFWPWPKIGQDNKL